MVLEYEFGIRKAMKSAWMCWPTTIKPDRLLKDPIQPLSIGLVRPTATAATGHTQRHSLSVTSRNSGHGHRAQLLAL